MFRMRRAISIFLLLLTIVLCDFIASAQSVNPLPKAPSVKHDTKTNRDDDQDVTLPEDMRIKMAITREENEYKKVLEDVDKLSGLSDEVARAFVEHKHLSPDEMKKLNTIEKLAKRILSHAGGDEVGDKSGSQLALGDAIDKLNSAASNIKKDMNAETRFVVSATVIANSNEVISLARLIKHIQKAD
jgi:hypothetical protein